MAHVCAFHGSVHAQRNPAEVILAHCGHPDAENERRMIARRDCSGRRRQPPFGPRIAAFMGIDERCEPARDDLGMVREE